MLILIFIVSSWTWATLAEWNCALYKPTFQKSDALNRSTGHSRLGVDETSQSCPLVQTGRPAWWMVDLQGLYSIKKIVIENRIVWSTAWASLNRHMETFIKDPRNDPDFPKDKGVTCLHQNMHHTLPLYEDAFICPLGAKARFVRMTWTGPFPVSMCDMKVLARTVYYMYHTYKTTKNVRFTNDSFLVLHTATAYKCALECNIRRDTKLCMAFNWNVELGECRLLKVTPEDTIGQIPDAAWTLYRIKPYY